MKILAVYILLCCVFLPAGAARAGTATWSGGGANSNWFNTTNWTGGVLPGAADDVFVTNGAGGPILTGSVAVLTLTISNKTLTFQGTNTVLTASNITVAGASGLVTHAACGSAFTNRVYLLCTNLVVDVGARIDVSSNGFGGGAVSTVGYGPGGGAVGDMSGGGGHGGRGGSAIVAGGIENDSALTPTNAGSGGGGSAEGRGGAGGGVIRLEVANTLTLNGRIGADGESVTWHSDPGAGAGGSIHITCGALSGSGSLTASGGVHTVYNRGGGGGGGRIAVYGSTTGYAGQFSARGGRDSYDGVAYYGQDGSLYLSDISCFTTACSGAFVLFPALTNFSKNAFVIDDARVTMGAGCAVSITNALVLTNWAGLYATNTGNVISAGTLSLFSTSSLTLQNGRLACGSIMLTNAATLALQDQFTNTVSGDITVCGSANILVYDRNYHPTGSVPPGVIYAGNIWVGTGATINADGLGFAGGISSLTPHPLTNGPGYGTGPNYGAGAGFGGRGGYGVTGAGVPGVAYGSNDQYCTYTNPTFAGSGGGPSTRPANGGAGGGVVRLIVTNGTLTVNGRVSADGDDGGYQDTGGGSGGSLYISANIVAGAGTISAAGGNGNTTGRGGGGAGGRLAIRYVSFPFAKAGTVSVAPGLGCTDSPTYPAGTGTTYVAVQEGYAALTILGSPAQHGTPIPNDYGTWGFLPGTAVTNSVNTPADESNSVRYACIGYAGTGDMGSGGGTQAVCTMSAGATLTWLWTNQYYLLLGTGVHGRVSASSGWYTQGVAVTISATNDAGYHFTQWSGDIPSDRILSNPAAVVMDQPRTIVAQFGKDTGEGKTWIGGVGYWTNAAGWDTPGMPGNLDAVTITNGSVTLENATAIASLLMSNATLTLWNWDSVLTVTSNITLRTNSLVTHAPCGTSLAHRIALVCSNLTVDAGARIDASTNGYSGGGSAVSNGFGPGQGIAGGQIAGGAGHGGVGGSYPGYGTGGSPYDSAAAPTNAGSGGASGGTSGSGGAGGGVIRLDVANTLTLNGKIMADGQTVTWQQDDGAGAGGSIYITCGTYTGAGLFSATGGVQSATTRAGGGGGGRIAVHGANAGFTGLFTTKRGPGGLNATTYAQNGSLYLSDLSYFASVCSGDFVLVLAPFTNLNRDAFTVDGAGLFLDANCAVTIINALVLTNAASLVATNGGASIAAGSLSLFNTASLTQQNGTLTCGNILLTNSATLALQDQFTNRVSGDIRVGGSANFLLYDRNYHPTGDVPPGIVYAHNINVDTGATINADGLGFIGVVRGVTPHVLTNGPGCGDGPTYGAGAGYGGRGGGAVTRLTAGGPAYGSNDQYCTYMTPIFAGSGGGPNPSNNGGGGGGVVRLIVADTLEVRGRVSADGQTGTGSGNPDTGGGSGGSVYITAYTLAGTGTIRAKGGDGNSTIRGGAGGGGRIAVQCSYNHFYGTMSATNGVGCATNQAPGTIYWRIQAPGTMFYVR